MCLENVPVRFYHKAMLGLPGRDEQIANMQATIRNMGRAGIPISRLPLDAQPGVALAGTWRRCAAVQAATRFDMAEHDDAPFTHGREFTEAGDVGQLRVLHEPGAAGGRGGRGDAGGAPRRPAGAVAGRGGAHIPQLRRLQARHRHLRQPAPRPRLLHGLLVGDGARPACSTRCATSAPAGASCTCTSATCRARYRASTSVSSTRATSTRLRWCRRCSRWASAAS